MHKCQTSLGSLGTCFNVASGSWLDATSHPSSAHKHEGPGRAWIPGLGLFCDSGSYLHLYVAMQSAVAGGPCNGMLLPYITVYYPPPLNRPDDQIGLLFSMFGFVLEGSGMDSLFLLG